MKIMIINGPNLNLLGIREPDLYGKETYEQLTEYVNNYAKQKGFELTIRQSNHEGDLIDYIQEAYFENIQGSLNCLLDVLGRACASLSQNKLFSNGSGQQNAHSCLQLRSCFDVSVRLRGLPHVTHSLSPGRHSHSSY